MTPQETLEKAKQMLLDEAFEPQIAMALNAAADVPAAAAAIVGPVIFRLMQEMDLPEDELFGSEEGDGIAIHLLVFFFEIAADAGYLGEPSQEDAVRAVELTAQLIDELESGAKSLINGRQPAMSEPQPMQATAQQEPMGMQQQGLLRG